MDFLSLAKSLRAETVENLSKKLHLIYMVVNEDFPWYSEEYEKIEERNNGFCENVVFSNIGANSFANNYKLCK